MYVQPNTLAKPIVNFGYFDLNKHFDVVLLKLLNLEITVNYLDKRKDQVIIIGDLKINVFKHDSTKKRLELLLNMSGLQAVINGPIRTQEETKSATRQVTLNSQLWDFKTQVSETIFQTNLDKHFIDTMIHCNKGILTLGSWSKKTSNFYCTGYILNPHI